MTKNYLFGIDIGGTSVKLGFFDENGELLHKRSFKSAETSEKVIEDCRKNIADVMAQFNVTAEQVIGAGIGVPGPVDKKGVVHGCVNMGWGDVELTSELSRLCGIKTVAQNDANVAALGEYWRGAGSGRESMLMVTLGTGVGGAMVINGEILAGAHNTGGELGHICINRDETLVCTCKKTGCLEQYASATAIVRMAKEEIAKPENADSAINDGEITAKRVFDLSQQGDKAAQNVIAKMTDSLGFGLSIATTICDPELIVLGGGVSLAGEPLLKLVREQYDKHSYKDMKDTEIALSTLFADAGIYGAAYMALCEFK